MLLVAGLVFFCAGFRAEEIQRKDGDQGTGRVFAVTEDVFQSKMAYGNIQVPSAEIISISFPENRPKPEKGAGTGVTPPSGIAFGHNRYKPDGQFPSDRAEGLDDIGGLTGPEQGHRGCP